MIQVTTVSRFISGLLQEIAARIIIWERVLRDCWPLRGIARASRHGANGRAVETGSV